MGIDAWSNSSVAETIEVLERELLAPKVRGDRNRLKILLAEEFREIGASGREFQRDQIINALLREHGRAPAISISELVVHRLSETVALATYRSQRGQEAPCLRSSIWRLEEGGWRVVFHQGTRILA